MFILLPAVLCYQLLSPAFRVTQSGTDLYLQEFVPLMDIRRAAPLSQGAFQA